jgi:hypothetical protein
MKPASKLFLAALAIIASGLVTGCSKTVVIPVGPTGGGTNQSTTVNVNVGQGAPTGTQPGAPGASSITLVKVTQFGETCPSGASPSGVDRSVRVGCTKALTCTPFSGTVPTDTEALRIPVQFFDATAGTFDTAQVQHTGNPYNLDVKGLKAGRVSFKCIVQAVESAQFDLEVVS